MLKKLLVSSTILFVLGLTFVAYIYGASVGMALQQLNYEGLEARSIAMELEFPLPIIGDNGDEIEVKNSQRLEEQLSKKIIFFGKYLEVKKYFVFFSDEEKSTITLFEDAIKYRLKNMDYYEKYDIAEPYSQSAISSLKLFIEREDDTSDEFKTEQIEKLKKESEHYHAALNYFREDT